MNNLLTDEQVNSLPIAQAATYQFLVDKYQLGQRSLKSEMVNGCINIKGFHFDLIINPDGTYY